MRLFVGYRNSSEKLYYQALRFLYDATLHCETERAFNLCITELEKWIAENEAQSPNFFQSLQQYLQDDFLVKAPRCSLYKSMMVCTLGCRATTRVEGSFGKTKTLLRSKSTLSQATVVERLGFSEACNRYKKSCAIRSTPEQISNPRYYRTRS